MDLTFKISSKENTNICSLVKQIVALNCRIKVDTEEGILVASGISENDIDKVINAVEETFAITAFDTVPDIEVPEPIITEESLQIAKIEFSNLEVEEQVNKLMRTIGWAMYSCNASSHDMCNYLKTTATEISMKYNPQEAIKFEIGDIVDCNYGSHSRAEMSGEHVHVIVCEIDDDGMVYVLPITKRIIEDKPEEYIPLKADIDVDYIYGKFIGGSIILRMGTYVRPDRFRSVVGNVRPVFFEKVLTELPKRFEFSHDDYAENFSNRFGNIQNDDDMLSFEETSIDVTEKASKEEKVVTAVEQEKSSETNAFEKVIAKAKEILKK